MTEITTPYAANTIPKYNISDTVSAAATWLVNSNAKKIDGLIFVIEKGDPEAKTIPYFLHPLGVMDVRTGEYVIVVDNRPASKTVGDLLTGRFYACGIDYDHDAFLALGNFPGTLFGKWITNAIARRFNLTPEETLRLGVRVTKYYFTLFAENDTYTFNKRIGTILRVDMEFVNRELESYPNGIGESLHEIIAGVSIRVKDLTQRDLLNSLLGVLRSPQTRESLAVALVSYPMFLGICLSLNDREFARSDLYKTAKTIRADVLDQFVINSRKLFRSAGK